MRANSLSKAFERNVRRGPTKSPGNKHPPMGCFKYTYTECLKHPTMGCFKHPTTSKAWEGLGNSWGISWEGLGKGLGKPGKAWEERGVCRVDWQKKESAQLAQSIPT